MGGIDFGNKFTYRMEYGLQTGNEAELDVSPRIFRDTIKSSF